MPPNPTRSCPRLGGTGSKLPVALRARRADATCMRMNAAAAGGSAPRTGRCAASSSLVSSLLSLSSLPLVAELPSPSLTTSKSPSSPPPPPLPPPPPPSLSPAVGPCGAPGAAGTAAGRTSCSLNFCRNSAPGAGRVERPQAKRRKAARCAGVKSRSTRHSDCTCASPGVTCSSYSVFAARRSMSMSALPHTASSRSLPRSSGRMAAGMTDRKPRRTAATATAASCSRAVVTAAR